MKLLFLGVLIFALVSYAGVASLLGPSQALPTSHFVDITDAAGIRFKHISAPDKKYIVESMSGGVALFDYDKDGCLDIYFTNAWAIQDGPWAF
ncbi:MAG: hypothetical protein AUI12_10410 [Acidobacteria bacterium 13_2_20CM_2_57_6]|nr:MAG: hypothetical protein AUI12_10410 [Acidobacteria bacterium 13_2_20CM_2_57_6]